MEGVKNLHDQADSFEKYLKHMKQRAHKKKKNKHEKQCDIEQNNGRRYIPLGQVTFDSTSKRKQEAAEESPESRSPMNRSPTNRSPNKSVDFGCTCLPYNKKNDSPIMLRKTNLN
jgi:hypothetical protein